MSRIPLEPGTIVKVNSICYRIEKKINEGGNSFIYEAVCEEVTNARRTVIKEFLPLGVRRENGRIMPDAGIDAEEFTYLRARIETEGRLSGEAGNHTYHVLHMEHADLEHGYMVMAMKSEDMQPLSAVLEAWEDERTLPKPVELAYTASGRVRYALTIISSILEGLISIHEKANILHGDISPGNIFWAGQDLSSELHGEAFFIDFGSAIPFRDQGMVVIENERYFTGYTPGYGAPEREKLQFPMVLTASADLYSVAVLLAVLCLGRKICKVNSWIPLDIQEFRHRRLKEELKRLSLESEIKKELWELLEKGIERDPKKRFQSALEMQDAVVHLLRRMNPKEHQLTCRPMDPVACFTGRETELEQLQQLLRDGYHTIFISGDGGLGKTELALKLAQKLSDDYLFFQITFHGDLEETVASLPIEPDLDLTSGKVEKGQIYQQKMACLRTYNSSSVLLIDNFDFPVEAETEIFYSQAYHDLMLLDMRVIFTTRRHPAQAQACVQLGEMSEEELLKIMYAYYQTPCEEKVLRELIREAYYHTLMVELMAKTMAESWGELEPQDLLGLFQNQTADGEAAALQEDKQPAAQITRRLKELFHIAVLEDGAKYIMAQTILFPINGISAKIYLKCHPEERKWRIRQLEQGGWIRKTSNNLLTIHPFVRSVCIQELQDMKEPCIDLMNTYQEQWRFLTKKEQMDNRIQSAEIIANAADYLPDPEGEYAESAGRQNYQIGRYRTSLKYQLALWKILEGSPQTDSFELLSVMDEIAVCYHHLADYDQAIACEKEVIAEGEKIFGKQSVQLLLFYGNLGNMYKEKGDYLAAGKYYDIVKLLCERYSPCIDFQMGWLYMNLAKVSEKTGRYQQAWEYCKQALAIYERNPQDNLTNMASVYTTMGILNEYSNNFQEAFDYYDQAISIYETVLGKFHPTTACSYNDKGIVLICLKQFDEALEYLDISRDIKEEIYGEKHPSTANTYHSISVVYIRKYQFDQAMIWCERAEAIRENYFGKYAPSTADSYDLHAEICYMKNQIEDALKFEFWTYAIYSMSFDNHPRAKLALDKLFQIYQVSKKPIQYFEQWLSDQFQLFEGGRDEENSCGG